jgi:hypothetical protein
MTKIVKSLQLPINEVTPQPPNGYGVLYVSASDNAAGYAIQYTNDAGETYEGLHVLTRAEYKEYVTKVLGHKIED